MNIFKGLYLFRGEDKSIDPRSLGEILVDKANRGVKVYVMVWSEKTSGDIIGEKVLFNYFHPFSETTLLLTNFIHVT